MKLKCHWAILGQAQVSFFVAGAILGEAQVSLFVAGAAVGEAQASLFGWQAQYLVKLKRYFSWQAQNLVKLGKLGGARHVKIFNTKCSPRARKVTSVARRVAD